MINFLIKNSTITLYLCSCLFFCNTGSSFASSTITAEVIQTINSSANSNQRISYFYNDFDIRQSSIYYYRLKIVEKDNSFSNSKNIKLSGLKKIIRNVNIFPNPVATGNLMIEFQNYRESDFSVILINELGQIIENSDYNITKDTETISISTGSLSSGIYYLKIFGNDSHTMIIAKEIIVSNNGK